MHPQDQPALWLLGPVAHPHVCVCGRGAAAEEGFQERSLGLQEPQCAAPGDWDFVPLPKYLPLGRGVCHLNGSSRFVPLPDQ